MQEPDWDALPASTSPGIRKLLHRRLAKDRRQRLSGAADARLEIEADAAGAAWLRPGADTRQTPANPAPRPVHRGGAHRMPPVRRRDTRSWVRSQNRMGGDGSSRRLTSRSHLRAISRSPASLLTERSWPTSRLA